MDDAPRDGTGSPTRSPTELTYVDARSTLEVADLDQALAFWTDVAGFTVEVVMGEPPMFALVAAGEVRLGLVAVDEPAVPEGAACYVTMQGLDELLARVDRAGLTLDVPLTTRPWGLRDVVIIVPGGGPRVAFGEPVA